MRATVTLLSVLLVMAMLLAGCGAATEVVAPTQAPTSPPPEAPTAEPTALATGVPVPTEVPTVALEPTQSAPVIKRGGVLKIGFEADATDLDPATSSAAADTNIQDLVYEGLVKWNPETMELEPLLAKSWEISPDGLTYTFHLQEGVKWQNGDPFVAEDVKFSVDRILDPNLGSTRASVLSSIQSVEVVDELTVVFALKEPYAPLLSSAPWTPKIQQRKFVEENAGKTPRVMMGTGPFMLKEWVPDQVIHLVKNPNYWRSGADGEPLPYLDGLDLLISPDETARVADFLSGVSDMILSVPNKDVATLLENPSVVMAGPESMWYSGLFFNVSAPPFDNKLVRQAVSWAIDRKEIAEVGIFGQVDPIAGGPFPDWHWAGGGPQVYDHRDLEKAKVLLADAGYPGGSGFPEVTILAGAPYQDEITIAEMTAAYLQELGISAKAEPQEWGTLLDNLMNKRYTVIALGWASAVGDPDEVYQSQFHSAGAFNVSGLNDPELDKVLDQARSVSDVAERSRLYHEAEKILLDDVPQAFVILHREYQALQPFVTGFVHMPTANITTLAETWLDK